jgi:sodium-independent sulfate anion transporter 11
LNQMSIDAAFGVSELVLLYGLKYICGSVAKKRPALARKAFFISSMRAVTVIFLFTLISYGVNHNRKKDPLMHLIGFIPRGFSVNSTPRIEKDMLATMLGQVPVAAVVMLIEHISIAKGMSSILLL